MIFSFHTTLWALFLSITYVVIVFVLDLDVFEFFVEGLENLEQFELDEFVIPFFFIASAIALDVLKHREKKKCLQEKNKIDQAIKAYSSHLAKNFEEEMRLFLVSGQKSQNVDPKVLCLFEKTIDETAKKIRATGDIIPEVLGEPKKENNILF